MDSTRNSSVALTEPLKTSDSGREFKSHPMLKKQISENQKPALKLHKESTSQIKVLVGIILILSMYVLIFWTMSQFEDRKVRRRLEDDDNGFVLTTPVKIPQKEMEKNYKSLGKYMIGKKVTTRELDDDTKDKIKDHVKSKQKQEVWLKRKGVECVGCVYGKSCFKTTKTTSTSCVEETHLMFTTKQWWKYSVTTLLRFGQHLIVSYEETYCNLDSEKDSFWIKLRSGTTSSTILLRRSWFSTRIKTKKKIQVIIDELVANLCELKDNNSNPIFKNKSESDQEYGRFYGSVRCYTLTVV